MRHLMPVMLFASLAWAGVAHAQLAPGAPTVPGQPVYALMSVAPVIAVCQVTEGSAAEQPGGVAPAQPVATCKVVRALTGIKDGETIKVNLLVLPGRAPSVVLKTDEKWLLFLRAQQQGQYALVRGAQVVNDRLTDFQITKSDMGQVIAPGEMPLADGIAALTKAIDDHAAATKYDLSPAAKTDDQRVADIGDNDELNLRIIGALAGRRACPQLLQLAQGPLAASHLRLSIIYALEQCPGDATENLLIGLLKSNDIVLVSAACRSLATLKSKRDLEPLLEIARTTQGVLPFDVARALAATGDPRAIEPLLQARDRAIKEDEAAPNGRRHPWLRAEYLRLLGDFDDPRVNAAIADDLKSDDLSVVLVAANLLYQRGDHSGIDRLSALLEADTSYANQAPIIAAFINMKAIEATPALIKLLASTDAVVRAQAANALRQLSREGEGCAGCGEDAAQWQEWWEKQKK
jgi:HEAT repeat protein